MSRALELLRQEQILDFQLAEFPHFPRCPDEGIAPRPWMIRMKHGQMRILGSSAQREARAGVWRPLSAGWGLFRAWCTTQGPLPASSCVALALRNKYMTVFSDFSGAGIAPQQVSQSAGMKTLLIFLHFQ